MKSQHFLTPYTKINSKWIKDLNVRPGTINSYRKAQAEHSMTQIYDSPPRIMEIKTKVNKWDLIKLKCFSTTKETISKVKRQPSEGEKNNSKLDN